MKISHTNLNLAEKEVTKLKAVLAKKENELALIVKSRAKGGAL